MVFKAFESAIFLKPKKLKQSSKQSEQSNQWSYNDKYTSLKTDNNLNKSSNIFQALTQVKPGNSSKKCLFIVSIKGSY